MADPSTSEFDNDEDLDGLMNWQEWLAKYELGLNLSVTNIFTDGTTPDYFKANAGVYAGEKYNGAEWIEREVRQAMGIDTLNRSGTRDYKKTGWDAWSTARYSLNNESGSTNVVGVSQELALVINYINALLPGEFQGGTLADVREFFRSQWGNQIRIWNDGKYQVIEAGTSLGWTGERIDGSTVVTAHDMIKFFGGKELMLREIAENKEALGTGDIAIPEPKINMTLRYVGTESKQIFVEAYQYDMANTEAGVQMSAQWTIAADFKNGLFTTELPTPSKGALVQGPALFVAYVGDVADVKSSTVYGVRQVNVGYVGADVEIALGDQNPALPKLDVSAAASNATGRCALYIVRSAINGKDLGELSDCVYARGLRNNLERDVLYPTEWVGDDFIGLDLKFAEAEAIAKGLGEPHVESVTYAVLVGHGPWSKTNYLEQAVQTFTIGYDVIRSKPKNLRFNDAVTNAVTFSFDVPGEQYPYTKFWMKTVDKSTFETNVYGGARGFILPNVAKGVVTVDPLADCGVQLTNVAYEVSLAIGNDKFGAPGDGDFCLPLALNVNDGRVLDGKFFVTVKHPTDDLTGGKMTVAAYEAEDLANPVAVVTNADCAAPIELANVRAGQKYYIAAWYVVDPEDGRWDATVRAPYDTWGYVCAFDQAANCFAPFAVRATEEGKAVTFYLQDTDWNANGVVDRTEEPAISYPFTWFDPADPEDPGIGPIPPVPVPPVPGPFPPEEGDDDPVARIANGDVMAYADVPVWFVWVGPDANSLTRYVVMDIEGEGVKLRDSDIPLQTSAVDIRSLATTYDYGIEGYGEMLVGVGTTNTGVTAADKVFATSNGVARLVHAQVYAQFGFEDGCAAVQPGTENAITVADGTFAERHPHTKAFTRLDKYLAVRYLQAIGVEDVDEAALVKDPANPIWDLLRYDMNGWYLDRDRSDSDRDDVADGWEFYVMFGVNKLGQLMEMPTLGTLADAKISPWNVADGAAIAPGAGSKLKLFEEFDGGFIATDPWNVDTDKDGVLDYYAYQYCLKGDEAGKDADGDGLCNYAEYLISEVFQYAKLDPKNPKTDGYCVDYFRKMGEMYFGEIFSDHDQVNDVWEQGYGKVANRAVYDPDRDDDKDGWSNYAEYRAGTDPSTSESRGVDDYVRAEYPVPVIEAKVVYNGTGAKPKKVVFKAWNEKIEAAEAMTCVPDAIWTFTTEPGGEYVDGEKYFGRKPEGVQRYLLTGGTVKGGSVQMKVLNKNFVPASKPVAEETEKEDEENEASAPGEETEETADPNEAKWYLVLHDNDQGDLVTESGVKVGTVDYASGLVTVDFGHAALKGYTFGDPSTGKAFVSDRTPTDGGHGYDKFTLEGSHVLFAWQAKQLGLSVDGTYYLADADTVGKGVREGLNTFICYASEDGSTYVPGAPFGIVRGVDVGWQGAKFTVELTERSAITPRIALWSDASDRNATLDDLNETMVNDRTLRFETNLVDFINTRLDIDPPEAGKSAHIRVVRYGINDVFCYMAGVGSPVGGFDQIVVADKTFDPSARDFLCEADFLGEGTFDIDWDTLTGTSFSQGAVVNEKTGAALGTDTSGPRGALGGGEVTNMTYLVVVGEGKKDFRGSYDTNAVRTLSTFVTRRFEATRHAPVVGDADSTIYSAKPTFKWSIPDEEAYAKAFGSSYTAFRLQICKYNDDLGNVFDEANVVYDSEIRRAPEADNDGQFIWTADVSAGSQTALAKVFETNGKWCWRVTMYNAKFRSDKWSDVGVFSTDVNRQQEVNDRGYSSIGVAVKYTGPSAVLEKYQNLGETKGTVRVQAFTSADFSGEPVAETFATNAVADVMDVTANATLCGLPQVGTYYVRAYIDMNGNLKKDEWEPWGCVKEAVTLSTSDKTIQTVGLYIEDADTDNDCLPDAWEYAFMGWTGDWRDVSKEFSTDLASDNKIVITDKLKAALEGKTLDAGISEGLVGASLTVFQNTAFAYVLLGIDPDESSSTFDAIREAVQVKIAQDTLKITSLVLGEDKIVMTVGADVAYEIAGMPLDKLYDLASVGEEVKVKFLVYRKATLLDKDWGDPIVIEKSFLKGQAVIEVSLEGQGIDFSSGFYKVEVKQ